MNERLAKRRSRGGGGLPGRGARTRASPPWAAAAPTPARWRWRPASRRTAATSTPTWTASTPPIRASCPRRGGWRRSPIEEMLEMASLGAKVLQTRSVEIAMLHRVPVRVLSTFDARCGRHACFATRKTSWKRNRSPASPIAATKPRSPCTRCPTSPASPRAIFGPLADAGVNVDMIVQNVSEDGKKTDLTFTVHARRAGARAGGDRERHADADRLSRRHP